MKLHTIGNPEERDTLDQLFRIAGQADRAAEYHDWQVPAMERAERAWAEYEAFKAQVEAKEAVL